jgi:DNA-binding response OmpR family regulator
MSPKILIIDDDSKLQSLLQLYLGNFGFSAIAATNATEGLRKLHHEKPDLVVLDVMLPGMDGFELCKTIRKDLTVPIIMLTARGEVTDRVVGLELGADDYIAKPFDPRELTARIHSVLRRMGKEPPPSSAIKQFGALVVDFAKRSATLQGDDVNLTTNEFEALSLLIKNAGKILNRDQILEALRGIECEAYNRSVDIAMSRLRHKLKDDPKTPSYIKTVWGSGYIFVGKEDKTR